MVDAFDAFPIKVLAKMRDAARLMPTDDRGHVSTSLPNPRRAAAPFHVSVHKDAYLRQIEAAIARRADRDDRGDQ